MNTNWKLYYFKVYNANNVIVDTNIRAYSESEALQKIRKELSSGQYRRLYFPKCVYALKIVIYKTEDLGYRG